MTVVRVREQGALASLLTHSRHSLPNFAVSCRVKVCAKSSAIQIKRILPLCAKSRLMHCGMNLMSRIDVRPLSAM